LQIKPLTRQGNEDKTRYFYRKGGTSCNYGIIWGEIRTTLIENQLCIGPPTGACDMKSPPFFLAFCLHIYFQ
jgi:hypothetical protein